MKPVSSKSHLANDAIKLPEKLYSADGREFKICRWAPVVSQREGVQVTIEAFVYMDQPDEAREP